VNRHVAIIRAASSVPPRYLHEHLVWDKMKAYLMGFNTGATREAVTKEHLEQIPVLFPDRHVLEAFERATSPIYAKTTRSACESRTLAALRNALLPKLISGELRVGDEEGFMGRYA